MQNIDLSKIRGKYKFNYNLSHLTWFKVGGSADVFFKPQDLDDLTLFLREKPNDLKIYILGAGSNIIIRDSGIDGVVIRLGPAFSEINQTQEGNLEVGAGCLNYNLAKYTQQHSITGFEFLVGIPGTIGGGIAMNAGAYGSEFKDLVLSIEAVDSKGNIRVFSREEIGFSYRNNNLPDDLIFTKVFFKSSPGDLDDITSRMEMIIKKREETQPVKEKTGGSTFANPKNHKAWELIDEAGLRGYSIGGASMSEKHCNFMINDGSATASDMEQLGEFVRKKVKDKLGVDLQWEIKRVGRCE